MESSFLMLILDLMEEEKAIIWSFMYMFLDWAMVHSGFSLLSLSNLIVWLGCK